MPEGRQKIRGPIPPNTFLAYTMNVCINITTINTLAEYKTSVSANRSRYAERAQIVGDDAHKNHYDKMLFSVFICHRMDSCTRFVDRRRFGCYLVNCHYPSSFIWGTLCTCYKECVSVCVFYLVYLAQKKSMESLSRNQTYNTYLFVMWVSFKQIHFYHRMKSIRSALPFYEYRLRYIS